MIEKKGSQFVVKSESGKTLSKPGSKQKAVKRLKQVEYFKNKSAKEKDSADNLLMQSIKKFKGEK